MKNLLVISLVAFLASCGGEGSDASGVTRMLANGQTGYGTVPGTSSTVVDSSSFLSAAFQDGTAEIALSQLALQKASDEDVKSYAQRMIDDHTQENNEIVQLAQAKNIALPSAPTAEQMALLTSLSNLGGIAFDRAYMNANVVAHEEDVGLFRAQALSGTDTDIATFAANTLPVLQAHLLTAKAIQGVLDPNAFLTNIFVDGKAEILLSSLALERAGDAVVKAFAQRMIDEHTQVNNTVAQLAQTKSIILPADITAEHRAVYEDLSTMSGADFDKAYMNHNVLEHASGVAQATGQADSGTDRDIKAFASTTLPALAAHLQVASAIYEGIEPSFLYRAFQDSTGEILLSKLALSKSSNVDVRQFAQKMINDHTLLNGQIEQLAQTKNVTLPREISPEQLRSYVELSQRRSTAFDQDYMSRNVDAHAGDVARFQENSTNATDADIRAFAAASVPVLSAHLSTARQIEGGLGSVPAE